ncbi:hypothetical protein [uncultured Friedmanniella sp.]|uniref:hypothetical protein n=1 Tax=uncultured Friedmanniella sp. TaxID=335381 RepID=UPI0035CAA5AB
MYDEVFAAGPSAIRRYATHGVQIPVEKFRIVGRPAAASEGSPGQSADQCSAVER